MKKNIYNQQPQVSLVNEALKTPRILRNPQHPFILRTRPFEIQPFLMAPVLAGETLKNLRMQSRVVTDPITNTEVGWWKEYYFFYVKLRDFTAEKDAIEQMLLNQGEPITPDTDITYAHTFHNDAQAGVNWTDRCLDLVVQEYFTDEGTTPVLMDGVPVAKMKTDSFWESFQEAADLTGLGTPIDQTPTADITGAQVEGLLETYMMLYGQAQHKLTFEDYLASFGVRQRKEQLGRPELIRFCSDWQYPSNTVNPANVYDTDDVTILVPAGAPTGAVSWAISERADKDRRFDEPGFIFGVTVTRPKMYQGQSACASHMLNDAFSWQPMLMQAHPHTTIKQFPSGEGPLASQNTGQAYVLDTKDLFMYGDTFKNFTSGTAANTMFTATNPDDHEMGYVPEAYVDLLFVSDSRNKIREDGVVNLSILGRQVDNT